MIELSNIVVSEGSVTEPVSLVEAKAWLQIDHSDHDTLLTAMIKSARKSLQKHLNLALVPISVTLDADNSKDEWDSFPLPYAGTVDNVVVSSVEDDDTETALVDGEDFYLRSNSVRIGGGRHYLSYDVDPGTISEDLKTAIKMEVAQMYAVSRGENVDVKPGLSQAALMLAQPHQIPYL